MANIPTPHNEAKNQDDFAKTVLMPGDPLRAKYIAEHYLTDVKQVNGVRGMLAFTGYYKGKKVSVMGSGMGMPSIGIYSYELFKFYDVDQIIRIGSAGSYTKDLKVFDCVCITDAYSESTFAKTAYGYDECILPASKETVNDLNEAAKKLNYNLPNVRVHSGDVFYRMQGSVYEDVVNKYNTAVVEMESYALFANARFLGKKAGCLLTISDSFVSSEVTTALQRQTSFNTMMEIALEAAIK